MDDRDKTLEQRIRDIIAVATSDIDAVLVEVEDGVAYVEGVVSGERERNAIMTNLRRVPGICGLVTCLSVEHVRPSPGEVTDTRSAPAPLLMHYYSLS